MELLEILEQHEPGRSDHVVKAAEKGSGLATMWEGRAQVRDGGGETASQQTGQAKM
ncbi:hypothetical protein VTN00DRAFT_371 [Thermoascus crustaceus]|uniref:uncharacterized protein n=1 Tax=Thermoascus crustaceus TaxID=5088 RepID=UPI0037446160